MTSHDNGWPSLAYETRTWTGVPRASYGPDAADVRPAGRTYQSAVPPHIADLAPVLDPEILAEAESATLELSRFDAELGDRVAAFAPVLLRSEAASSSQIEQLTASARQILTAELGARANRNATQIAANTRAMTAAIDLAHDTAPQSILRMHEVLMEQQPRHTPGRWRSEPVWIGRDGDSPLHATYVAPHEDLVPSLIDDLVAFSTRSDIQPLAQVALAHAQFETIHPFTDGNGRTGRAFAQSLLRRRGVTRNVAVPVSAGLLSNVPAYHDALTAYRAGDLNPIVRQFADASVKAIANSRRMLGEIDAIKARWAATIRARRDSNVWPLLDIIARRPVIDAISVAAELGVQRPNAYPPLRLLTDAGILKSKNEHQAGPVWRSDEILNAIDAFAERAGRRTWE